VSLCEGVPRRAYPGRLLCERLVKGSGRVCRCVNLQARYLLENAPLFSAHPHDLRIGWS
jgi:hypothetical protein